jgi:general secretion pathway protein L
VFGSFRRAGAWFIDGLVDAWIAASDRLRRGRRVALVRSGEGYAIERRGGRRAKDLLRLQTAEHGPYFVPAELAATLRNHDIDLVLAGDEVLVRTLDPLPGESRLYLDSIVHHQLERVAPWRADDVLHTYRVAPVESGGDRLSVTVIATARSMHAQVLDALRALRPRELRLLCRNEQFGRETVAIPVDHGAAAAARQARLRGRIAAAVALLVVAALGAGGFMGWTWYRTDAELTAVAAEIAAQRQRLMAARPTAQAGDRDLKAMVERRWNTPFAVLALDALTHALPDDTWLTDLRLSDGRVRMTGVSRNVAELVPLIGASAAFADATFFAPTARLPDGQGDRFHLEARVLPMEKPRP